MLHRLLIATLITLSLALLPACAMMVLVTNEEQAATSDLIIVGTITNARELPGVPDWQAGQAVIRVEKVLKGDPGIKEVTVRYPIPPKMGPGVIIMDHGGMVLNAGQQQLFVLQRAQGGYTIVGGTQGMHPIGDADKFAALVKEFPLAVTLDAPVGPFYFGRTMSVKVTVTNTGKTDFTLYQVNLEGFYLSERLGSYIPFNEVRPALVTNVIGDANVETNKPIVKAGGKYQKTIEITCTAPISWQLLGQDTYIQTPALVRARIFVQNPAPAGAANAAFGFNATSAWIMSMVGYPPPKLP